MRRASMLALNMVHQKVRMTDRIFRFCIAKIRRFSERAMELSGFLNP